jgi:hypothetical protein
MERKIVSNISYIGINEQFPIAGVDNPSDGFRLNFGIIKESLKVANLEVADLEKNAVRIDRSNNFDGNVIENANLISTTTKIFEGGEISVNTEILFNRGFYQTYKANSNITLTLRSFPTNIRHGIIRLVLTGADKLITFDALESPIFYDKSFPAVLRLASDINPDIIEVWFQESVGFFLKYLGRFDTDKSGNIGGSSAGNVDIATRDNVGVVRIGDGLSIQPNGLLTGFSGEYDDLENRITDINQLADSTGRFFSGDYNDLDNLPDLSALENDGVSTNFITILNGTPSDIPGDLPLDSVVTTAVLSAGGEQGTTLTLDDSSLLNRFASNQKIRLFGASPTNIKLTTVGTIIAVKTGFTGVDAGTDTVEYKISLFTLSSGSFGAASPESVVTDVNLSRFNLSNTVTLSIQRTSSAQGILIYRKTNTSIFELIAVLGSKNLGTSSTVTYVDYYDFDRTLWSGTSVNNSYISTTGIIHFPVTTPASASYGWSDAEIQSVDLVLGRIVLKNSYFFNSSVTIAHDDTDRIQAIIDQKTLAGIRELKLGSKTYNISKLSIPNNFILRGISNSTILKKLAWTYDILPSNKMLESINNSIANNIFITNITLNGNMQNQFLIDESSDSFVNYAIDLSGSNIRIQNVNITNIASGGIASVESNTLFIRDCQITNSGMVDRDPASPITCEDSFNIIISNNILRNFASSVDATLINTGVIVGNIVENCGQGISIFGSLRLISNPNLILGPAGEYIAGPDIFNSEYDAVNIALEPNTTFISDAYTYQENGQVFDLTANRASIFYRIDKLRKVDNVEELYGEILIGGNSPIANYLGPNNSLGQFKFAINQSNVDQLKTTYSYSTLKQVDSNHQGLVYRAILKEYFSVVQVDAAVTPTVNQIGSQWFYEVAVLTTNDLSVGANIRFSGHGGTPSLNFAVGQVSSVNPVTKTCIIAYDFNITSVGSGGSITRENSFVLAKGKIL